MFLCCRQVDSGGGQVDSGGGQVDSGGGQGVLQQLTDEIALFYHVAMCNKKLHLSQKAKIGYIMFCR